MKYRAPEIRTLHTDAAGLIQFKSPTQNDVNQTNGSKAQLHQSLEA